MRNRHEVRQRTWLIVDAIRHLEPEAVSIGSIRLDFFQVLWAKTTDTNYTEWRGLSLCWRRAEVLPVLVGPASQGSVHPKWPEGGEEH